MKETIVSPAGVEDLYEQIGNVAYHVSNTNGEAWKFDSGLMIVRKAVTGTPTYGSSSGAFYYATLDLGSFPVNFTSKPDVHVTVQMDNTSGAFVELVRDISTSSAGIVSLIRPNQSFGSTKVAVFAIGNWK